MQTDPSIFKAYDIRGIYPSQIDKEGVFAIAQAYAKLYSPKTVAVGADMRLCGEEFKQALIKGFTEAGVNVMDIGLVSTDQFYFGVYYLDMDGGIVATASHNPKEYGGLKLVREKALPVSGDSGIYQIKDLVISDQWQVISEQLGKVEKQDIIEPYFDHVLSKFNVSKFKTLKIVANANFGMAGPVLKYLQDKLPVEFMEILNGELDGCFPKGRPDPLRPETRGETIETIKKLKPDLGVAWDADADRCFFFDEKGEFITPAYTNALLSEYYLKKYPGGKILHDTRVVRVIQYAIEQNHGVGIQTKAGHSFIKERMAKEDAVFGTETSGHYFFKENFYLDNGLMPFLAMLDILSKEQKPFSEILKPLREKFFISEEINFEVGEPENVINRLKSKYQDAELEEIDGQSYNYANWRFNVRKSNTENLLRVNVEADSNKLLNDKISEVSMHILKL